MPCRRYFWPLILVLFSCAPLLRRSSLERGLDYYKKGDFRTAAVHFNFYYSTHPGSDSALYYLYDCYVKLDEPKRAVDVLKQLAKMGTKDKDVYLHLFYAHRKNARYRDLYMLLTNTDRMITDAVNQHFALTRQLFAELVSGVSTKAHYSDPVAFVTSHGYMSYLPDGKFYGDDTITQGNLIILLDTFVRPIYPQNFFKLENITNRSFLYLPYMRLIDVGVLALDPDLDPNEHAPISMAVEAIGRLKQRGYIE